MASSVPVFDKSQPLDRKAHSTAETLVEGLSGLDLSDSTEKQEGDDQLKVHDEENGGFGGRKRVNTEDVNFNPSDLSPPVDNLKGEPLACIFVASLNAVRSDDQLTDSVSNYFQQYGDLIDVKVQRDWQGRPYAFVQYHNATDAKNALKYSTGQILDSRHIRVEQARVNRTLFLAKFDKEMTKEEFREMVEQYGPVEEVSLLHNFQTGKSRGCGFVKYKFRDDAIRAFPVSSALSYELFDNKGLRSENRIVVQWAANLEKDPQNTDKTSVFVGRLNSELVTQEALYHHFSAFGDIEEVNLVLAPPPRPSFAFVKFTSETSALAAIESENGKEWLDRFLRVKVKELNAEHEKRHRTTSTDSNDTLMYSYQPQYGQQMQFGMYQMQNPYAKQSLLQPYYYESMPIAPPPLPQYPPIYQGQHPLQFPSQYPPYQSYPPYQPNAYQNPSFYPSTQFYSTEYTQTENVLGQQREQRQGEQQQVEQQQSQEASGERHGDEQRE